MSDQQLRIRNFNGGLSDDDKFGPANSFSAASGLNFRTYMGKMNLLKKLQKEADSVSGSLSATTNMDAADALKVLTGDIYIAAGNVFLKRTQGSNGAAGTYSVIVNNLAAGQQMGTGSFAVSGALTYDLDYNQTMDALFLYGTQGIIQYSPILNGTPAFDNTFGGKYSCIYFSHNTDNSNTYTLPTTISELATAKLPFTASVDGIIEVNFNVGTKGTGDWMLTLHDAANRVIATTTLLNTNITPGTTGSPVYFPFTSNDPYNPNATRNQLGQDYHFHLTVSGGTSSVQTGTAGDFSTAANHMFGLMLIDSKFHHRTIQYGNKTYFCNERYLGEWEILDLTNPTLKGFGNFTTALLPSGYNPYALVFPSGYVSCGIALYSEYIATACAVDGVSGMILFWDATSSTYNFTLPVPQGVPEGLYAANNALYWTARGVLYTWAGNDIEPVYAFPGTNQFKKGAAADTPAIDNVLSAPRIGMASRRGMLQVGFPRQTANTNIEVGMYSYGTTKRSMPMAVSKDYLLSTGSTTTAFNTATSPDTPVTGIKLVKDFGTDMIVAWQDLVGGVVVNGFDYINDSSPVTGTASWRSLWFDNNNPDVAKTPKAIKVTFRPLPEGCTVTPTVEYDRSGTEITGLDSNSTLIQGVQGDMDVVFPLDASLQFYEARFGFSLTSANGNDMDIISITFKFDDNRENAQATEDHRHVN